MKRWINILFFLLILSLLAGCFPTRTRFLKSELSLDTLPKVETFPLKIGVYYNDEIYDYQSVRYFGSSKIISPIGQDSIDAFDTIFPIMFREVTQVDIIPPYEEHSDIDFVIEPNIDHFRTRFGLEGKKPSHNLTYSFTLYSKTGIPFSSFKVIGSFNGKSPFSYSGSIFMNNAIKKLMADFSELSNIESLVHYNKARPTDNLCRSSEDLLLSAKVSDLVLELPDVKETDPTVREDGEEKDSNTRKISLKENGFIVLEIDIQNNCRKAITYSPSKAQLNLKNIHTLRPAPKIKIISSLVESRSHGGEAISMTISPLLGTFSSLGEEAYKNSLKSILLNQLTPKLLSELKIGVGESVNGFLIFESYSELNNAELIQWISDDENNYSRILNSFSEYTSDTLSLGTVSNQIERNRLQPLTSSYENGLRNKTNQKFSPGGNQLDPQAPPKNFIEQKQFEIYTETHQQGDVINLETNYTPEMKFKVDKIKSNSIAGRELLNNRPSIQEEIHFADIVKLNGVTLDPDQIPDIFIVPKSSTPDNEESTGISYKKGDVIDLKTKNSMERPFEIEQVKSNSIIGREFVYNGASAQEEIPFSDIIKINGVAINSDQIPTMFVDSKSLPGKSGVSEIKLRKGDVIDLTTKNVPERPFEIEQVKSASIIGREFVYNGASAQEEIPFSDIIKINGLKMNSVQIYNILAQ